MTETYNVGGVMLPRPFQIRKLSHVSIYYKDFDQSMRFYASLLGFRPSDIYGSRMSKYHPGLDRLGSWLRCFLSNNTDHHTLVLAPAALRTKDSQETTLQQFSWELGSFEEIRNASEYVAKHQVRIDFVGKRMPGGNYNLYVLDPDLHRVELGWGHEQVGWTGYSKPASLWWSERVDGSLPERPVRSPQAIGREDFEKGDGKSFLEDHSLRVMSYNIPEGPSEKHDVEGVLEDRPFRIIRPRQVGVFVKNLEKSVQFFVETMGFNIGHSLEAKMFPTESNALKGERVVLLEHDQTGPSLCLYPIAMRESIGTRKDSSLVHFGFEVQSYGQLCNSIDYLNRANVSIVNKGRINDGNEFVVDALDPDGHTIRLWYRDNRKGFRPDQIKIPPWRPDGKFEPLI